ncbi:amino acid transporter [Bacillus salacetis]|uniref:amino acid transporter n=1 Tax=Bacillus salacetis TaxID=2315464 RepID=UPI003BA18245
MTEKKPFNDATEHMKNIEGYPSDMDLKKLPRPLRYFGYFFITFFALSVLFIIIANIVTK